ncbi:hypothetical protein CCR95_02660 [Thiocystis minor]|uniref:methyl-accepting chemotaxis protein n=1 Tax=Thiocystis minor TaxID=61597 RepID=UPI001913FC55|nr:methyl-accepting chemotaxis protein [Thiocystis minor]MBK5963021.1 hypothetical protein [Thiocystis minor]
MSKLTDPMSSVADRVAFGHSILFRTLIALFLGVVLVASVVLAVAWVYLEAQSRERAEHTGERLLGTLIQSTRESINKGQRQSFQRAIDDFTQLDGVIDVALFARFRQMVYRSGVVSVGLPFVHEQGRLVNEINEKPYRESKGRFQREDWDLRDAVDTPASRQHIQTYGTDSCADCHYVLDEQAPFDPTTRRLTVNGEGFLDFYYALPVESDCVVCHTHWREGEDGGYLRVRMDLNPFTDQRNETLFGMTGAILGVLVPTILILMLIFRALVFKPLARLRTNLTDLTQGEGDLTRRLAPGRQDEMGQIAWIFNGFIDKVQTIVIAIKDRMAPLESNAGQLLQRSEGLLDNSARITNTLDQITLGAKRLRESARHVETSVEEVRASLGGVEQSVDAGQRISSDNRRLSEDAMHSVQAFDGKMAAVSANSRGILDLLDQIKRIAGQTNLLALNAAIEAARAGESGRGFAVVADEVRALAGKTAELTQSIDRSLASFSDEIESAESIMHETIGVMRQVSTVSAQGERELADAAERLRALADAFANMQAATDQQHEVTGEIVRHIDDTSAAAADTHAISIDLAELARSVRQAVSGVAEETSKFRTGEEAKNTR